MPHRNAHHYHYYCLQVTRLHTWFATQRTPHLCSMLSRLSGCRQCAWNGWEIAVLWNLCVNHLHFDPVQDLKYEVSELNFVIWIEGSHAWWENALKWFWGGLFTVVIPVSDQTTVQGWVIVSSQCFWYATHHLPEEPPSRYSLLHLKSMGGLLCGCVWGGGGGCSGSTFVQNLLAHSHISEFWFHKLLVVGLGATCLHDNV